MAPLADEDLFRKAYEEAGRNAFLTGNLAALAGSILRLASQEEQHVALMSAADGYADACLDKSLHRSIEGIWSAQASRLPIEMTETTLTTYEDACDRFLKKMSEFGLRIPPEKQPW